MTPFKREGACEDCGREYTVSGAALNPGAEIYTSPCRVSPSQVAMLPRPTMTASSPTSPKRPSLSWSMIDTKVPSIVPVIAPLAA